MAWGNTEHRYLVRFSDGGSGIRTFADRPEVDGELQDGGRRYRLVRVEHRDGDGGFGHAWAEPVPSSD
jgi:hypothetical protein